MPLAERNTPGRVSAAGSRWPRGMRRDDAAAYLGISTTKFDDWVSKGVMPGPKRQGGVIVWDRYRLDQAFESLPDEAETSGDSWAHLNGGNSVAVR